MKKRILALMCAAGLVLCGCSGKEQKGSTESLSYWMSLNPNLSANYEDMGQTPFGKELESRTGTKIEYIHPVSGQEQQSLSMLIASDELPDIIEYGWLSYLKGPENSIKEGIILELNDLIDKHAPNFKKYLKENPEVDKLIKTDSGQYYMFPFIRGDKMLHRASGLIVRNDWLEELDLEIPETVDELENVLRVMKKEKNLESPLLFRSDHVGGDALNIFGATNDFYVEDGEVKYGPLSENYKYAMEKLNQWYDEKLLDNNFLSTDSKIMDASVLNDKAGVFLGGGGGDMGKWLDTAATSGKEWDPIGIPDLKDEDGNYLFHGIMPIFPGNCGAAISASCKDPVAAVKFLDYAYSEEGHMFYNFGVEGDSYTMVDGKPQYTEKITNNPDGLTMTQAMAENFRSSWQGPFVQDKEYIMGYYYRPNQRISLENWTKSYDQISVKAYPNVALTAEESTEYANIMLDVNKYISENRAQFIVGTRSLATYDEYIKGLKDLKIDRAIELKQNAYDRYIKR